MQLGFVLDQSRCIGCHACTVACKSENDVPVGSFRTWVKYTEQGEFPAVKRSFAVLRCNQCTQAPCVTICPVKALEKRPDGIVDVDPAACIGCKSCMHGCPYDALYINPDKGTAEKCHFCAHRTEQGLAPACAVVCPTEAIIPGDFDDPESVVSKMRNGGSLRARKVEAGTGPNVFYNEVNDAGIDPLKTASSGGHIWADRHPGLPQEARAFDDEMALMEEHADPSARARTTYDVAHPPLWGGKITGYLFFKALAAGVFLAGCFGMPGVLGVPTAGASIAIPLMGLLFLTLTTALLIADLKRPERFLYIITRPNWDSWLVRGTWFLIGYGGILTVALLAALLGARHFGPVIRVLGIVGAFGSAAYTGWLFGQAKGRVLWMQRGLWLRLAVQALLGGAAVLILAAPLFGLEADPRVDLERVLGLGLLAHGVFLMLESKLAPTKREAEYARVLALVKSGPFSRLHWLGGVLFGTLVPITILALYPAGSMVAAALALIGLWIEKNTLVRAGQALPIS